jgi:hypothetical protein
MRRNERWLDDKETTGYYDDTDLRKNRAIIFGGPPWMHLTSASRALVTSMVDKLAREQRLTKGLRAFSRIDGRKARAALLRIAEHPSRP